MALKFARKLVADVSPRYRGCRLSPGAAKIRIGGLLLMCGGGVGLLKWPRAGSGGPARGLSDATVYDKLPPSLRGGEMAAEGIWIVDEYSQ